MPRINLLPHRELERQARQERFNRILAGIFMLSILLVALIDIQVHHLVSDQRSRNRYLASEIQKVTEEIGRVNELRTLRTRLLDRIRVIERLQARRSLPAHLFDQLTQTIPAGVYLTDLSENAKGAIVLKGIAQSPAKVSNYMRRIAASPWLADPQLNIVRTHSVGPLRRSIFIVQTEIVDKSAHTAHGPSSRSRRP
jgi:type IV pilus assembly protein PilN